MNRPVAQLAEAAGSNPAQCGFDSHGADHSLPCGCARGHCEAATVEQCQQIQASALALERCLHSDYSDLFAADAVRSGREKLTC